MDSDKFINRYLTGNYTGVGSGVYAPGTVIGGSANRPSIVGRTSGGGVRSLLTGEDKYDALEKYYKKREQEILSRPEAARVDLAGINARALKEASRNINPAYRTERTDIVKDIENRRKRAYETSRRSSAEVGQLLDEFLEESRISRERTGEDVASNLEELAIQEQLGQELEAEQATKERTALADELAASGLTTSGLGKQQVGQQKKQRLREAGETARQFDKAKVEQVKYKTRTFEDLARGEGVKKAASQRELAEIRATLEASQQDLAYEKKDKLRALERDRKRTLANAQGAYAAEEFANFLTTLSSGQAEATSRAYGGFF